MMDTLKALCALSGVSGDEGEVRDYIISQVSSYTNDVVTDIMGNVIVTKKGVKTPEKKIMLCAHMDEVGVIVTSITDDGFLKFSTVGGVDDRVVVGKIVKFGKERVFGIIGTKAMHFLKAKDREKALEANDLYIDIGAKNREEAEKLVKLGDTGAFDDDIRIFGDGFIKAKAIDDRFGCTILLELIKTDLPIDCIFVFSVQEEVGLRGASTAAFRAAPDIALIVEGTTSADFPAVSENKKICKIGCGAVIPFMDNGTIYDREMYSILTRIADENGIKRQTKTVITGGTDSAAVQRSRAGVKTAGIAAPVRNLHSSSSVAKISDMEAVLKLVKLFIEEMGGTGLGLRA